MSLLLLPPDSSALVHSLSGVDLSSYTEELEEFRRNRSFNLRRSINLCKTRVCKPNGKFYVTPRKSNVQLDACKTFTVEGIVEALMSGDPAQIDSICQDLCECVPKCPKIVQNMVINSEVQETFIQVLDSETPSIKTVINTIAAIFKLAGETQEQFIDSGLSCSIMNIISQESDDTIKEIINLAGEISQECCYARDSIICLGVHSMLIDLATKYNSTEISSLACEALHKIFSNPDPIETEIVKDAIPAIIKMISGQNDETISFILSILVDISSKQPSSVFIYYNLGLYSQIVSFIKNPALTKDALKLAGNMAVSQPLQILSLIENGIIDVLHSLMETEYLSDVFWIYANLLESYPDGIFQIIDDKLIEITLNAAEDGQFDIKQEASFLIATCVVFGGNPRAPMFFNERIFGVLSDVLGCGVNTIALRCLDALNTFLGYANISERQDEFLAFIADAEVEDRLHDIEYSNSLAGVRSQYLLLSIQSLRN